MSKRFLFILFAVLAAALPGTLRAQTAESNHTTAVTGNPAVTGPNLAGVTNGYTVSYRKPGVVEWTEFKVYPTIDEANHIAKLIQDRGYEIQVLSKFHLPKVPAPSLSGSRANELPLEDCITPQQAVALQKFMLAQKDIAYAFPIDGCYARAHLMCQRMEAKGYRPFKAWTFANGDEKLYVRTPNHPNGYVEWKYHVAPIVRVRFEDEQQRWYVIDPSLFNNPVTITKWREAQKKNHAMLDPFVTLTRLGHPPKDPAGVLMPGSGYWPGKDPRSPDAHAMAVMRLYKPYEGRVPPASVYEEFKRIVLRPRLDWRLRRDLLPEDRLKEDGVFERLWPNWSVL
jgi:hypothetical protein